MSVIDGTNNSVVATVSVPGGTQPYGSAPWGVGVNPITDRVYVASYLGNIVAIFDGTSDTVVATVAVGSQPTGVGVNPRTNGVYVANNESSTVSVISDGPFNAQPQLIFPFRAPTSSHPETWSRSTGSRRGYPRGL